MMYDSIAFKQLKKYFSSELINRIPAFSSTLAMYDKMCDCTHYPWGAKMPQLLALTDKLRRGHEVVLKSELKAKNKAEDIEIRANERFVASSVANETPMDVKEAERDHDAEIGTTESGTMGAVKAEATSNALSEKIDHDAEIALIEEATARAVAAETPSYPEGKISVPIYP